MTLRDFFTEVESRRRTITAFAPAYPTWLAEHFETRHVDVAYEYLPPREAEPFLVVSEDRQFLGSVDFGAVEAMANPSVSDPGTEAFDAAVYRTFLSLLPDTLFSSFGRRQLLATAREIEDRAFRTGRGELHVGFQSSAAFRKQSAVYERLAADTDLDIYVYGDPEWDPPATPGVTYYVEGGGAAAAGGSTDVSATGDDGAGAPDTDAPDDGHELGRFWFVVFDGDGNELRTCALLAEERDPDAFYGFWTYDPALVGRLVAYLRTTYPLDPGRSHGENETP